MSDDDDDICVMMKMNQYLRAVTEDGPVAIIVRSKA
jgi:hypothetical protein